MGQICSTRDSSIDKSGKSIESPERKDKDFSSNSERREDNNDGDALERLREDVQKCQFKLRSLESLLVSTSLPSHKRVSDTHSYEPRAHSFGSDLSRNHKFGATVLTPEQQLRRGRVHLLPSSRTKHTENNFASEMEKRAKELVLEPTQEYMRNNIARALVEDQHFKRRNSILGKGFKLRFSPIWM